MTNSSSADLVLRFQHISKRFGGTQALHDVSFDVRAGEIHALLGGNGSGKSTLIKILSGVYRADSGSIVLRGSAFDARKTTPDWARAQNIRFVHQAVGTFRDMSVADNFALAATYSRGPISPINDRALKSEVGEVLVRFGIDASPEVMMADLSPATQTMVAVARALRFDAAGDGILVLDEPTATLPLVEQSRVLDAIKNFKSLGHTIILISHRLDEVLAVADTATFLRDGRHQETSDLAGVDEAVMIRRIAGIDQLDRQPSSSTFSGKPRLLLKNISTQTVRNVSFEVHTGEILGLAGLLGSGRSSILSGLFGLRRFAEGAVTLDDKVVAPRDALAAMQLGFAYVSPERQIEGIFPEESIRENLVVPQLWRFWKGAGLSRRTENNYSRGVIERFNVVASGTAAPISSLSGGNQQKVLIARWIEMNPKVLLLNEPTQGVDVGARAAIHNLIRSAAAGGTTVIVASSDSRELAELCHRVLGLYRGENRGEVQGDELNTESCMQLAYGRYALGS
jgi:ribose transport system ATP-binding protein